MKQYSLNDLHTFVAVIETGSFSKAAERLDTSAASVSRRVASLEAELGVRLLHRTTRLLQITESGQQFFTDIQNVLGALEESEERLTDQETSIKGHLRIVAPLSFGIQSIAPLLPEFLQEHPDLYIDLQLEDKQTDLYSEGIDLAIRIGQLNDSALIATKLCEIEFGYFASPAYLAKHGEPDSLAQLAQHLCLTYNLANQSKSWGVESLTVNVSGPLSANNGEALCEAAIQGLGIILMPHFIVEKPVAEGKLVSILNRYEPKPAGLYAIRFSRKFTPAKVRVFIDYLKERLQR